MNSEYVNASKKRLRDDRHAARLRPKIGSSSLVSLRILFPSLAARGEVPRSPPYAVRKPQAYNAAPFPMASRSTSEVSTNEHTNEHINEAVFGRDGRVRVTAAPLWMRVVIAPAALRCQDAFPGVALTGINGPILEADQDEPRKQRHRAHRIATSSSSKPGRDVPRPERPRSSLMTSGSSQPSPRARCDDGGSHGCAATGRASNSGCRRPSRALDGQTRFF